jgi:hypothetical protein
LAKLALAAKVKGLGKPGKQGKKAYNLPIFKDFPGCICNNLKAIRLIP